jgi:hypothetical protein
MQISAVATEAEEQKIRWARYPELAALCWNLHVPFIAAAEALRLYEDNWRFVNLGKMPADERELVNRLSGRFGSYLHV